MRRHRRGVRVLTGLALTGLTACQTLALQADPFARESLSRPPITHFEVDDWLPLVKREILEFAPREAAGPAFDPVSHLLIVATRDGRVHGVDLTSEKAPRAVWSVKTGGVFNAGATVHEGIAYVPGGDGVLYALDAKNGTEKWKYKANEELVTSPVIADGKVLFGAAGDALIAVDVATGAWKWQYRRDPPIGFTVHGASAPRVDFGVAYVGFSDGFAVALNVEDGTVKWERSLAKQGSNSFLDVDTRPALDDSGRLYLASYREGIYSLNPESGDVEWRSPISGVTSLITRGEVLFWAGNGQLGAIHGPTGEVLWRLELAGIAGRSLLFARGMLVVPTDQALLFVNPATGKSDQRWDPGEGVSAPPLWSEGRLYVLSNLGTLYAMRLLGRGG